MLTENSESQRQARSGAAVAPSSPRTDVRASGGSFRAMTDPYRGSRQSGADRRPGHESSRNDPES